MSDSKQEDKLNDEQDNYLNGTKKLEQDEKRKGYLKLKIKNILFRILLMLLSGLIILGIGYGIAIFIANRYDYELRDAMFTEGMIVFIVGILASMKGNPSGGSISGIGMRNENASSFSNLEAIRLERDITNYYKNFRKNTIVEFAFSSISILLGGAFIMSFSILFL